VKKYFKIIKPAEFVLLTILFAFSQLLMWKTFRLIDGELHIATKVWSDFAATFPIIRSFSLGYNFPPEYPLFAGEPIRYHFGYYFIVGMLEKIGVPLDFALNTLSGIGFFLLLAAIYFFAKHFFKSWGVGLISVLLFLFHGSLGFLEFFKNRPPGEILNQIITNNSFTSFGPYDGKIVSAFWSLNIYTNQKHLAWGYFAFLLLIGSLFLLSGKPKKYTKGKIIALALLVGIFPFMHMAVFAMMVLAMGISFIVFRRIRRKVFITGIIAGLISLPQVYYLNSGGGPETQIIHLGYLAEKPLLTNFPIYWFYNLGLTMILAPIGFLMSGKKQRQLMPFFLTLFVVGNTMRFSPEIAANHKFFNLAVIGFNFYTAYFLYKMFTLNISGKLLFTALLIPLTLTGVIDLFPVFNDRLIKIADWPNNPSAAFIKHNTPPESVFLNASYLYDPASIAGRRIYLGWPYFSWSAGYDTDTRGGYYSFFYTVKDKDLMCRFLLDNNIDYFSTQERAADPNYPDVDLAFFKETFTVLFENNSTRYTIYETRQNCRNVY
jgi:hypothetical protein